MAMKERSFVIGGDDSKNDAGAFANNHERSLSGSKAGATGECLEIKVVDGVISGPMDKSQMESPPKEAKKKTWSELDKYIELLLDSDRKSVV